MKRYHAGQQLLMNGQLVTVERHIGGNDYIVKDASNKRIATNTRFLAAPVGKPTASAVTKGMKTNAVVPASKTAGAPTGSDTTEYTGWGEAKLVEELKRRGYAVEEGAPIDDMIEALVNDDAENAKGKT